MERLTQTERCRQIASIRPVQLHEFGSERVEKAGRPGCPKGAKGESPGQRPISANLFYAISRAV